MIGLDIFITIAMAYMTYINYQARGPRDMWTILSALCTLINVYGLSKRF